MADASGMRRQRVTTRDRGQLQRALGMWLERQLGTDAFVLTIQGDPSGAGMSSDTVLFDVDGNGFVLRLPPPRDAFPLFPDYDLARQATAMRLVAARSVSRCRVSGGSNPIRRRSARPSS